jgi:hypothetical protein
MRLRELLPWREFVIETSWPPSIAAVEIEKVFGESWCLDSPKAPIASVDRVPANLDPAPFSEKLLYQGTALVIRAVVDGAPHGGSSVHVRMSTRSGILVRRAVISAGLCLLGVVVGIPVGLVLVAVPLLAAWLLMATAFPFVLPSREVERFLRSLFVGAPPGTGEGYR